MENNDEYQNNDKNVFNKFTNPLIKETDPLGMSTGVPLDENEEPVQDACDL